MRYLNLLVIGLIIVCIHSCQKEESKIGYFVLSTKDVQIEGTSVNGVTLSASVVFNGDEKINAHGFVYGTSRKPSLGNANVITATEVSSDNFSMQIEDVLVPETKYYVRSFIKTDTYMVYGNEVSFYSYGSEAPRLEKIEPDLGLWRDTIMVTGENFEQSGEATKVWFNDVVSEKFWVTNDTIYAIVPNDLYVASSQLSVEVYGKKSKNTKTFNIISPVIDSISYSNGQHPDTLTIYGKHFVEGYGVPRFSGYYNDLKILEFNANEIKIIVPFLGGGQDINVNYQHLDKDYSFGKIFHYNEQKIIGVSADSMYITDTLMMYANNLDFRKIDFVLKIGNSSILPQVVWKDSIRFCPSRIYVERGASELNLSLDIEDKWSSEAVLFEAILAHKDPVILRESSELYAYGSKVLLREYGVYYDNGDLWFENIDNGTANSTYQNYRYLNEDNKRYYQLSDEMTPGRYSVWLESRDRYSNKVEIEIAPPSITDVSGDAIMKRSYEKLEIQGDYLPWSGSYILRNEENGQEFVVAHNSHQLGINNNEIDLSGMIGSGKHRLQIQMGELLYDTDVVIEMEDYLYSTILLDRADFNISNSVAFVSNGRYYFFGKYSDNIDYFNLSDGTRKDEFEVSASIPGIVNPYPIHYGSKVYVIFSGKLYVFNTDLERWEEEVHNFNDDFILTGCVVNDKLQVFTRSGRSYIKDASWSDGPFINAFQHTYGQFCYATGEYLYVWEPSLHALRSISLRTGDYVESYAAPFSIEYNSTENTNIFVKNGDIYFSYSNTYRGNRKIYKFSPSVNEYKVLDPYFLPGRNYNYMFAQDHLGNIYIKKDNYIYKFIP